METRAGEGGSENIIAEGIWILTSSRMPVVSRSSSSGKVKL